MCRLVGFESSIVDLMFKHDHRTWNKEIGTENIQRNTYISRQTDKLTEVADRQTNKKIG